MRSFQFTKMHGLGNNYIYVNMFKESLLEEELVTIAVKVSNIYTGIGSDGMILICPSDRAAVKMRVFNNDGSEAKNCGNGLRCVAKYAYEHNLVTDNVFTIETLSGIVTAEVFVENGVVTFISVDMGVPRFEPASIPVNVAGEKSDVILPFNGRDYFFSCVSMGNPHAVTLVEEIEEAPLTILGPVVEKHDLFPDGVNVEFIEIINEHEIHFRVWERGSGVTQACGTGACAAVVVATCMEKVAKHEEIIVHLAGGDLMITWTNEGNVIMKGPAEVICNGVFYY
ncbi:diaminopimelate epimerase [Priestia taiwanensis]|uniref:Diaminopimelate epimerase n=1 Tax=Priestia taiwanensis TaxID=1347902 RepID=A0A917AVQ6_9BACI|nr:diaminopimelate epimerase [Priestia taiwanensis]MBM7364564.1 diaminopimelate epimerase [Priestia taiwanensis]GGE80528.1 diaminopimelate epimerase [Priestia taiwanensis]